MTRILAPLAPDRPIRPQNAEYPLIHTVGKT